MKTLHFFPEQMIILVDDQVPFSSGDYVINNPITPKSECFMVSELTETTNAVKVIATSFGSMNGKGTDFLNYNEIATLFVDSALTSSMLHLYV